MLNDEHYDEQRVFAEPRFRGIQDHGRVDGWCKISDKGDNFVKLTGKRQYDTTG
jgi:hypothetical protein